MLVAIFSPRPDSARQIGSAPNTFLNSSVNATGACGRPGSAAKKAEAASTVRFTAEMICRGPSPTTARPPQRPALARPRPAPPAALGHYLRQVPLEHLGLRLLGVRVQQPQTVAARQVTRYERHDDRHQDVPAHRQEHRIPIADSCSTRSGDSLAALLR